MIIRGILAVVATLALLVTVSTAAFAWAGSVEGQPALTPDSPLGYYIWHDDSGMHLRTHGPGEEHLFTARLHTDGIFEDIDTVRLESRDKYQVLDGGHTLLLRFHTYGATDGVNFRVSGGTKLRFALYLNGELIDTDSIFLGPGGVHPESNPFTIKR